MSPGNPRYSTPFLIVATVLMLYSTEYPAIYVHNAMCNDKSYNFSLSISETDTIWDIFHSTLNSTHCQIDLNDTCSKFIERDSDMVRINLEDLHDENTVLCKLE